ncbi:MAG TPA: class III poly(R)-hydroxyalkanoic acid synthase subunit PhaE [Rudaea sp.]|uniref:class III poly(R)-hydroxyalkanoic acid synthase subunit PhaE n=1 Tax=Rudaea sp. TaxID=2136325 RepID=UPI002F9485B5
MSDSKPVNDWLKDWQALQRQYLNAWSDLSAKASTAAPPPAMPFGMPFAGMAGAAPAFGTPPAWHEGLEQWARLFAGSGNKQSETAERMLASAQSYVSMIQSMFGAAGQGAGAASANPAQAWFDSLRGGFAAPSGFQIPGMDTDLANNPFAKALRDISGQGAKGFTEMPAAFAPFIEQMRQEGLSWLRVPAFGVGREHQEHYQKTALAFVEYQQALKNYNALMLKASQRGFELFEGKLAERSEPGRSIDSLRALYDLWVDAAEEAYAEVALSDEFAKVYGELANAQMRARAQIQAEVERVSTDLGMPTRSELNGVHKRLHDLRRELRDGGRAQADNGAHEAEIAALQAEVKQLKRAPARKQDSVASAPKAAVAAAAGKPRPARTRRRVAAKPRPPAPVVKPRPLAASSSKSAGKGKSTFGDAIAAMRRRVGGKPGKLKAVAAGMSKPSKQNKSANADDKTGKRKK